MISRDAVPIAHIPPLKPINLRPTYPHAQTESRTFWEIQYEESLRLERGLKAERMWRAVVEFAQGRGVIPQGVAPKSTSGPLIESEGHSEGEAWPEIPIGATLRIRLPTDYTVMGPQSLEDDRNSTEGTEPSEYAPDWEADLALEDEIAALENELGGEGCETERTRG